MFNMSHVSIEKSYNFPFKDISLDSLALNSLEIFPRKKEL